MRNVTTMTRAIAVDVLVVQFRTPTERTLMDLADMLGKLELMSGVGVVELDRREV
jgi:hypothetical protein